MSLDVELTEYRAVSVFDGNITHNLGEMADAVGLYDVMWQPEEVGITKARQMIEPLEAGLGRLVERREDLLKHSPKNGWGTYEGLVEFVRDYLRACRMNPDADVRTRR